MRIDQPNQAPGRVAGLVGTVVVHAGAVLFLVAAVKPTRASPPSYAVELVAAPAPTTKRLAREALPTPPPEEKPAPTPPKPDRKSTRLNSSHPQLSRMPSSA